MNVAMFNTASKTGSSVFAGNLPMMQQTGLKSTHDKLERQQKAQSQIAFWENQKENLKNAECDTIEDIAKKLDKFHSYESEIDAAKMQYNREQMWHTMDEAKEIGEKIAEEAEKFEPKTAEERREDMIEEALETDEGKGELTEGMEEMQEEMAELTESMEEMQEEVSELTDDLLQTVEETVKSAEKTLDNMAGENVEAIEDAAKAEMPVSSAEPLLDQMVKYKRIDVLI